MRKRKRAKTERVAAPGRSTRTGMLLLRLTPAERAELDEAAAAVGLGTGSWLRAQGFEAARERLALGKTPKWAAAVPPVDVDRDPKTGRTTRTAVLPLRFTPPERKLFDEAAKPLGVGTGSWLRAIGLEAARAQRERRA